MNARIMPSARVGVVQLGSQETSNDIDASAPAASLLPVVPAADVEQLRDGELASATSHLSEDELAAKKLEESRRRAAASSTHGNVPLQGAGKAVAQMNGAVNGMTTLKQKLAERIQAEFDNFSLVCLPVDPSSPHVRLYSSTHWYCVTNKSDVALKQNNCHGVRRAHPLLVDPCSLRPHRAYQLI